LSCNDCQNSLEVLNDLTILESDQPDSGALEEQRAEGITVLRSLMIVSRAV